MSGVTSDREWITIVMRCVLECCDAEGDEWRFFWKLFFWKQKCNLDITIPSCRIFTSALPPLFLRSWSVVSPFLWLKENGTYIGVTRDLHETYLIWVIWSIWVQRYKNYWRYAILFPRLVTSFPTARDFSFQHTHRLLRLPRLPVMLVYALFYI